MRNVKLSSFFAAVVVGFAGLGTTVLFAPGAAAAPAEVCRPEALLSRSAPEVGAVYAQSGAYCNPIGQTEAWVTATLYRDGSRIGSRSAHCRPGEFRGNYCTTPLMYGTDPSGQQTFTLVVTIRFVPIPGRAPVDGETSATGSF